MGNLNSSSIPFGDVGRAAMLRSAFQPRQLKKGMQQLSCDVVFGSPSANCLGTGVCKISARSPLATPDMQRQNCASAPGILIALEEGQGVSLVMAREMLCVKLMRTQFRHNALTLQEPCRIPDDVVFALGLKFRHLRPGTYQLEEANGFFKINFRG